jgi:hypothetical protein
MVVTGSRLHAVRYKRAFDQYVIPTRRSADGWVGLLCGATSAVRRGIPVRQHFMRPV